MANKTSAQPSFIQEDSEVDECNENIAPGDLVGHSSKPRSREIREAEDKPWTSGVQSALTPVLRSLNISNKCPSPEPLKHKGNLHVNSPCMPSNLTMANSQKSATSVSSIPSLFDFYSKRFGRAVGDKEASLYLLENEYMPEVTLFDVTCDSTMELTRNYLALPDSVPATPITPAKQSGTVAQRITSESYQNSDKEQHKSETCLPKVSKHNGTASGTNLNAKIVGTPSRASAPEWWLDLPEITLLDVTCDSGPSPGGEVSSVGISRNVSPADSLKDNTPSLELTTTQPGRSDGSQIEFSNTLYASATHPLTSCSEKSDSAGETAGKTSLIQDVSMDSVSEKSRTSPEPSKRNMAKNQTSLEDTQVTHPADVTHDTSSSPCTSAVSQLLTFDMQRNASSKTVPSEQHSGHVETLDIVDAKNQLLNSDDVQKADKMLQPSPETDGSANSTFTIAPPSNLSTSTISNTTIQKPSSQNKTLDLSTGTVSSANADIDTRDQANSVSETPEISLPKNQNLSADKASGSCGVQNATFDQHSLLRSRESTSLGEACAASLCLQNHTFESKPSSKQNGTITLSETSSNDSHHNTLDKPSPSSKVCNSATSPKDNDCGVLPADVSKRNKIAASTDCNDKMVVNPEITFEVSPAVEVASGAKLQETKDHSQSSLPMTDGISDTVGNQSMDTGYSKANTFNLDDTLDLKVDPLVTSTPMTNCKMFSLSNEREEGKVFGAQKKLYGDGPGKPDVPLNIVCDRKTFLKQPTIKSILPPLKAASQLLKYKPASILPKKFEPLTLGLPMTRQRTQAEALRNTAAPDAAQRTMGISSSYNLSAMTTGSKPPNSGLPRPPLSNMSSGIQKAAPGLRPPTARNNAPASSSTDKLHGSTAANPVMKNVPAKKHPLTRADTLPTAKRSKMEAPLASGCTEASTSSCAAANRAKSLKHPTTTQRSLQAKSKRDGCAKCVELEHIKEEMKMMSEEMKIKSEEIRQLREELLKYRKQKGEC